MVFGKFETGYLMLLFEKGHFFLTMEQKLFSLSTFLTV